MSVPLVRNYQELISVIRERRQFLGINQLALDDYIGLPDGYIGKIEAGHRTLGPLTMGLVMQGLGLIMAIGTNPPIMQHPPRSPRTMSQIPLPLDLPRTRNAPKKRRMLGDV